MSSDDVTRERSGAASARPQPGAVPGIERALRRKGKALTPDLFLRLADWVVAEREKSVPKVTQAAFATKHGINVRQVQTYEAVARWPSEAKAFVRAHAAHFSISDLTLRFANRSWRRKDALLSTLRNHVEGTGRRRKRTATKAKPPAPSDPDVLAMQERLRDRLRTRVEIVGGAASGEIRIAYLSLDEFERILDLIERE